MPAHTSGVISLVDKTNEMFAVLVHAGGYSVGEAIGGWRPQLGAAVTGDLKSPGHVSLQVGNHTALALMMAYGCTRQDAREMLD